MDTPSRGRIEVAVDDADPTHARISVRDNGRGIPAALLPYLFRPLVQGQRAFDRSEGGLGIGLTLVKLLVDLHGGSVEVQSDGADTGATFTVRWPRALRGASSGGRAAHTATSALRILIADDNQDAAELLADLVRACGHEVLVTYDGHSALQVAEQFPPDVALLDIGLPGMDGYELARGIRGIPACTKALLIAITGMAR